MNRFSLSFSYLSLSVFHSLLILLAVSFLDVGHSFAQPSKPTQSMISRSEIEFADQARIYKGASEQRKQLTEAQKEFDRRRKRLIKLEQEVISRYKALRQVQKELTATLKRSKNDDDTVDDNVDSGNRKEARLMEVRRLAKTFNSMKPAQAARVVEVMDEDLVVDVLRVVKPRQSGKILGAVDPKVAARISEQMTSTRRSKRRRGKR